jgi:DNA repair exonuclease SbcCD nuclease subunit
MMTALGPALARGLGLVMIAGNHDRDYFMETANEWLGVRRAANEGRIVLATRPRVLTVEARGERLNFVLLPFPNPSRYAIDEMDDSGGAGARNERIARYFVQTMESLRQETAAQGLPAVLLTHLTVEGTEVGPHRISPRDDVVVPRANFPAFEMTVVGHIHKPEKLGGGHFYYVGVLDRMDMGEIAYQPEVLLADIGPKGVRDVQHLELDPTPFAEIWVQSEEDLRAEREALRQPDLTLVKLHIRAPYGTYTAPLIARARELFPRLYGNVEHEWTGAPVVEPTVSGLNVEDVTSTIHRYLEEQVPDSEERAALLELVGELRVAAGDDW